MGKNDLYMKIDQAKHILKRMAINSQRKIAGWNKGNPEIMHRLRGKFDTQKIKNFASTLPSLFLANRQLLTAQNRVEWIKDNHLSFGVLLVSILCVFFFLQATLHSPSLEEGIAAFDSGEHEDAIDHLQVFAREGNSDARYRMGLMYEQGLGVEQNYQEAVRWYSNTPAPEAQSALYNMILSDQGRPQGSCSAYYQKIQSLRQAEIRLTQFAQAALQRRNNNPNSFGLFSGGVSSPGAFGIILDGFQELSREAGRNARIHKIQYDLDHKHAEIVNMFTSFQRCIKDAR